MDEAQDKIDEVIAERDGHKRDVDLLTIELRMKDETIDRLMAIMKLKGIKLSDFDEVK